MTPDYDAALAELKRDLEAIDSEIGEHEDELARLSPNRAACAGEIRGFLRARELLGSAVADTPATEPKSERHAVQRVVMALFEQHRKLERSWIVAGAGLPEKIVNDFLLRAARQGKLLRDGDVYSLPLQGGPTADGQALPEPDELTQAAAE